MALCRKASTDCQPAHAGADDHDASHTAERSYARRVHIARLSVTPLKGTSHTSSTELVLDHDGPRDDRRFCLLDPSRARVLRTVENPTLVACRSMYDGTHLGVQFPDGSRVEAEVGGNEEPLTVDYWGRPAVVSLVDGPWAAAFTAYLGYDVVLAQVSRPGQVVFGGPVTLLSTSSLREVAERLGRPLDGQPLLEDSERFRSTVVIDTGTAAAFVEDAWDQVMLGSAVVRVRGPVPRCAVVRISPLAGVMDSADPLRALAPDRAETNERGREVVFGVDADVVVPGMLRLGDVVQVS